MIGGNAPGKRKAFLQRIQWSEKKCLSIYGGTFIMKLYLRMRWQERGLFPCDVFCCLEEEHTWKGD